jgi:hypothetical protein
MRKKKLITILVSLVLLLILHFTILSFKISYSENIDIPKDAISVSKKNIEDSGLFIQKEDKKTKIFLKLSGGSTGEKRPIIIGYYKTNNEVVVLVKSFPDRGGFAIITDFWYTFKVDGEYEKIKVIGI